MVEISSKIVSVITGLVLLVASPGLQHAFANPNPLPWENWKTDFERTNIDVSEIRSGGPPKDGIPAIDDPKFISVEKAENLADRAPVIGIEINGDARAYPLGILMRHEICQ